MNKEVIFLRNCGAESEGVLQDNLVLSTEFINKTALNLLTSSPRDLWDTCNTVLNETLLKFDGLLLQPLCLPGIPIWDMLTAIYLLKYKTSVKLL